MDCLAAVRSAQRALTGDAMPAFAKCVLAAKHGGGGGGEAECSAAELAAVRATQQLMDSARELYDRGGGQDYTAMARTWVHLCRGVDSETCFGRLRTVIRKYRLNYAWRR